MTVEVRLKEVEKYLKSYAMKLTMDRDNSKDLYQDTVEAVLNKYDMFLEDKSFKNWTVTIMRNIFIDQYRKDKRNPVTSYSKCNEDLYEDHNQNALLNSNNTNVNNGYSNIVVEDIHIEIQKLPEQARTIILLRLEKIKFKDIAIVVKLTELGCRSIYFKYIRELRTQLSKKFNL